MARNNELYLRFVSDTGSTSQWLDAYERYGMFFTQTSLSKLMTPAPNKAAIENKSRRKDGKSVVRKSIYTKKDDRDVDLEMHITAPSESEFWRRYDLFCTEILDRGFFDICTKFCPTKVFRMTYLSCTQFSEFVQQLGKFTLRLNEPDPSDRDFGTSSTPW